MLFPAAAILCPGSREEPDTYLLREQIGCITSPSHPGQLLVNGTKDGTQQAGTQGGKMSKHYSIYF